MEGRTQVRHPPLQVGPERPPRSSIRPGSRFGILSELWVSVRGTTFSIHGQVRQPSLQSGLDMGISDPHPTFPQISPSRLGTPSPPTIDPPESPCGLWKRDPPSAMGCTPPVGTNSPSWKPFSPEQVRQPSLQWIALAESLGPIPYAKGGYYWETRSKTGDNWGIGTPTLGTIGVSVRLRGVQSTPAGSTEDPFGTPGGGTMYANPGYRIALEAR